jgi:hypothetical protein
MIEQHLGVISVVLGGEHSPRTPGFWHKVWNLEEGEVLVEQPEPIPPAFEIAVDLVCRKPAFEPRFGLIDVRRPFERAVEHREQKAMQSGRDQR